MRCFSGTHVNNWQLTTDGIRLYGGSAGGVTQVNDLLTPSKDPGSAFKGKAFWQDSKAITNYARGQKISYGNAANWRKLRMHFLGGATYVGFSLQQWDTHKEVFFVFDAGLPSEKKFGKKDIKGLTKSKDSSNRDGYVMFKKGDDCCGFKTLDIGTGNGDGFAIDHITFKLGKGMCLCVYLFLLPPLPRTAVSLVCKCADCFVQLRSHVSTHSRYPA